MSRNLKISLFIAFISALLFVPFIGRLHLFDWDEINFAESAREMLLTKDFHTVKIFFKPFWEKPPLFIWLQVLSMKIFGVNEFAARFPNAVCGIITLVLLFNIGRKFVNEKFGIIWTVAYGVSMLPFFYFKSGIIDPWFNLFIFLGISLYFLARQETVNRKKFYKICLSAIFIGLAVLTKGPVAILVFGLTAFILMIFDRFRLNLKGAHIITFIFVLVIVGGFWFLLEIFSGHWHTIVEFFDYQVRLFKQKDAGHGGFPLYHFVVLFFGVFPASVFAIQAHKKNNSFTPFIEGYRKIMLILFWVVLILFSIVKTKIVHYSSLCYYPITFLAAYSVYGFLNEKKKIPKWAAVLQIFSIAIISLAVIILPVFDKYKEWFIKTGKITQAFTVGNLQANPGWNLFVSLIGVVLLLGGIISIRLLRGGCKKNMSLIKKASFLRLAKLEKCEFTDVNDHFEGKRNEKNGVFLQRLRKQKLGSGFKLLALSSLLFIWLTIIFVAPGIEKYSQNAEIEFFKSLKNKDVYSQTFYKSYAMLFYTDASPNENPDAFNLSWLISGKIDKDAYFVIRADKKNNILQHYKNLEVVYEKNGYVFCVRRKP